MSISDDTLALVLVSLLNTLLLAGATVVATSRFGDSKSETQSILFRVWFIFFSTYDKDDSTLGTILLIVMFFAPGFILAVFIGAENADSRDFAKVVAGCLTIAYGTFGLVGTLTVLWARIRYAHLDWELAVRPPRADR